MGWKRGEREVTRKGEDLERGQDQARISYRSSASDNNNMAFMRKVLPDMSASHNLAVLWQTTWGQVPLPVTQLVQ